MADINIQQLILEIDVPEAENALWAREESERLFNQRMKPLLEKTLNRFHEKYLRAQKKGYWLLEEQLEFNTLDIDLGDIFLDWSDLELEEKFRQVLSDQLQEQMEQKVKRVSGSKKGLEIVQQFLKTGTVPWWHGKQFSIGELLDELLEVDRDGLVGLLFDFGGNKRTAENAAQRLAHQIPEAKVLQIIRMLKPEIAPYMPLVKILNKLVGGRQKVTASALAASMINSQKRLNKLVFFQQVLHITAKLQGEQVHSVLSAWTELLDKHSGPVDAPVKELKNIVDLLRSDAGEMLDDSDGKRQDEEGKREEEQDLEEELVPYFIENAGMVLYWPFLVTLFDYLKWTEGGEFVSRHAQSKAVLALQLMATGEKESTEAALTLNKVLCGMSLEQTVLDVDEFTDDELDEFEEVQEAMIAQWGSLKSTSVEGLMDSFFVREGQVQLAGDMWTLLVDQKPYDIMLDKLPWNIEKIQLPWMSRPLTVSWETGLY